MWDGREWAAPNQGWRNIRDIFNIHQVKLGCWHYSKDGNGLSDANAWLQSPRESSCAWDEPQDPKCVHRASMALLSLSSGTPRKLPETKATSLGRNVCACVAVRERGC